MYEDEPLPAVAFATPLCLIGVTALILVVRIGGKLAAARAFQWGDGKPPDVSCLPKHKLRRTHIAVHLVAERTIPLEHKVRSTAAPAHCAYVAETEHALTLQTDHSVLTT